MDKVGENQVIHAPMSLLHPRLQIVFPQGMLIFFPETLHISPLLLPFKMILCSLIPIQENRSIVLHIHPLRALYGEAPGIGSGQGGIQGQ